MKEKDVTILYEEYIYLKNTERKLKTLNENILNAYNFDVFKSEDDKCICCNQKGICHSEVIPNFKIKVDIEKLINATFHLPNEVKKSLESYFS